MSTKKDKVLTLANKEKKAPLNHPVWDEVKYPQSYIDENKDKLGISCIFDVEGTGLDSNYPLDEIWGDIADEIIELAILKFYYNKETLEIVKPLDTYQSFNEPTNINKISDFITNITGITHEDVKGKKIDWKEVIEFTKDCDFAVAHNAQYDQKMVNKYINAYTEFPKCFCSYRNVDWNNVVEGSFLSASQEILSLEFDVEHDSHRAIYDVCGLFNILSKANVLNQILEEKVEVRSYGFLNENFRKIFYQSNGFRYESKDKYWYKTVKKKEVQGIVDIISEYGPKTTKGFTPAIVEEAAYSTKSNGRK